MTDTRTRYGFIPYVGEPPTESVITEFADHDARSLGVERVGPVTWEVADLGPGIIPITTEKAVAYHFEVVA